MVMETIESQIAKRAWTLEDGVHVLDDQRVVKSKNLVLVVSHLARRAVLKYVRVLAFPKRAHMHYFEANKGNVNPAGFASLNPNAVGTLTLVGLDHRDLESHQVQLPFPFEGSPKLFLTLAAAQTHFKSANNMSPVQKKIKSLLFSTYPKWRFHALQEAIRMSKIFGQIFLVDKRTPDMKRLLDNNKKGETSTFRTELARICEDHGLTPVENDHFLVLANTRFLTRTREQAEGKP